jgi:ubiquitin-like protein Pup
LRDSWVPIRYQLAASAESGVMMAEASILAEYSMNGKSQNNNDDSHDEIEQRQEQLSDDVDAILDQIDDGRLEENAEEYVRSYVQKGGQGWSEFLTPEFFVGAAATGAIAGATYDMFKESIRRIVKALRQTAGPSNSSPLEEDDSFNSEYERVLKHAWDTGIRLAKQQGIEHSIDEATALHWILFAMELQRSLGSVNLGIKRYKRLARASAADAEHVGPSRLAARIIDEWLKQHPTPRKKKSPSRRRRPAGPSAADYL